MQVENRDGSRAVGRINLTGSHLELVGTGWLVRDDPNALAFRLVKPLHVEEADELGVAFFEVDVSGGNPKLGRPLKLAPRPMLTKAAAVIGYTPTTVEFLNRTLSSAPAFCTFAPRFWAVPARPWLISTAAKR